LTVKCLPSSSPASPQTPRPADLDRRGRPAPPVPGPASGVPRGRPLGTWL